MANIHKKLSISKSFPLKLKGKWRALRADEVLNQINSLPLTGRATGRRATRGEVKSLGTPRTLSHSLRSRQPLLRKGAITATTTLATILFLLSATFSLTLLRNKLTGAVTDTGAATLNKVDIIQAGTGQSVTINGTTLTETGDNKSRRAILNNNIVKYKATYNVTTSGTLTFTFTLPPNNTIDEGTLAQCSEGSKLSMAEVDGIKSYTNNQATCIRNVNAGQTTWDISAYLWGGNGEQITPTLEVSGAASSVKPDEITLMGKLNYGLAMAPARGRGSANGFNENIYIMLGLYAPIMEDNPDMLGVEPVKNGDWSMKIDTSELPDGWKITAYSDKGLTMNDGMTDRLGTVHSGVTRAEVTDDGKSLTIRKTGSVTGTGYCPTRGASAPQLSNRCYYSTLNVSIGVPVSALSTTGDKFTLRYPSFTADGAGGVSQTVATYPVSYSWTLNSKAYGNPVARVANYYNRPGWNGANTKGYNQPVYAGETMSMGIEISPNVVPTSNKATDVYLCVTWNPQTSRVSSEFIKDASSSGIIMSDYIAEYGVSGTDMSVTANSASSSCGKVGDGSALFSASLSEANRIAQENGLTVNALRLWIKEARADTNTSVVKVGSFESTVVAGQLYYNKQVQYSTSGFSKEWSERSTGESSDQFYLTAYPLSVPGIFKPGITAEPSSNNPSRTEHITVTPYTYGQEQNGQISVNLPSGLTPTPNSFTMGGVSIPKCSETVTNSCYTISNTSTTSSSLNPTALASSGTSPKRGGENNSTQSLPLVGRADEATQSAQSGEGYAITFNLGTIGSGPTYPSECSASDIASNSTITTSDGKLIQCLPEAVDGKDSNGNPQGVKQDSKIIEFDATVDKDVSVPSTLTISATANGDGTKYASDSFKTVTAKVTVANPPAEFGYNLTTTPANPTVYAKGNLAYNIESRNTTDNNVANLTTINVLPYNDGLTYDLDKLSIDKDAVEGVKLYYTTDEAARELDQTDPEALGKSEAENNIAWTECILDKDGNCTNLPDALTGSAKPTLGASNGVTAIKYTADTLPSGANPSVSYGIANIVAKDNSNITNNISYLSSSVLSGPVTHQNPNSVVYKGELLQLELDKKELTIPELRANTIDKTSLSTTATVRTSTINGYSLTISPVTDGNGNGSGDDTGGNGVSNSTTSLLGTRTGSNGKKLELPTLQSGQTLNKNTPAWAVKGGNQTNWIGFDQSKPSLDLHTSTLGGPDTQSIKTSFAISSGDVVADTYQGAVRYTLTAGM